MRELSVGTKRNEADMSVKRRVKIKDAAFLYLLI
jgi:hypothetical protein